ncbi:MAG: recombination protein RecR [Sedimentisphaerales bacterium]|nr:recombination protein RecR [Sedimentisphaerales bacterium]
MSNIHTESMDRLMEQFARLPGIGKRSAQRLAYYILMQPADKALALAEAIGEVKTKIRYCSRCYNLSEQELCEICRDPRRDQSIICVVEQHKDLICLEETGLCHWVYHILLGHLAPLEGVTPDDLTISALIKRVETEEVREVIMATNPTTEGDGTTLYVSSLLADMNIKVTRLARGLPSGGSIEHANKSVLIDAIKGRMTID